MRYDVLGVMPTHLLGSEGATTGQSLSWLGMQDGRGTWLQKRSLDSAGHQKEGKPGLCCGSHPSPPHRQQAAETAELPLVSTQLPLTAAPEQAQEMVLGSRILDTDVLLRLALCSGVKGEQPSLPGTEGSRALLGLRNTYVSLSRSEAATLP